MKKLILSVLLLTSLTYVQASDAKSKNGDMDKCQVSGGEGSLMVEAMEKSKMTITVTSEEGRLIVSEVSSDSGKLQLLGLATGFYEVEIKSKKNSKVFRVEVQ